MRKIFALLALLLAFALPVRAQFSRITSVTLQNTNGTQAAFYTSPYTMKLGANCTWVISGTTATLNCAGGAAASVPFSGITGSTNTTAAMVVGTGASLGVSGSGTINSTTLNGATFAAPGAIGGGTPGSAAFTTISASGQITSTLATGTAPLVIASTTNVPNLNASSLNGATFAAPGPIGSGTPSTGTFTTLTAALYASTTNCADSAGDAACGAAPAGSVVVDATDTTTVVSTTAVTANSEIFVEYDSSLGTRLGVTCNVIAALPAVTARTAATSFTITLPAAPVTNPACYSYHIIN